MLCMQTLPCLWQLLRAGSSLQQFTETFFGEEELILKGLRAFSEEFTLSIRQTLRVTHLFCQAPSQRGRNISRDMTFLK